MTTVLLLRHGRTQANLTGVLAGRTPGVELDDVGIGQAAASAERIAPLPIASVVSSPLRRCRQTAKAVVDARAERLPVIAEAGLIECGYGSWTGRKLRELAKEDLWRTVQQQPSAVRFPDGEAMTEMSARATATIRTWDAKIAAEHGDDAIWVAVSHGDVIKAILADALGMHLDSFQRIMVDPASISVIHYAASRPFVLRMNTVGQDLASLMPKPAPKKPGRKSAKKKSARQPAARPSDAAVGGGMGADDLA
ncbi:histidine phosphatase family protein [Microlunatus soli]|uniref:2,3-bisphosphoglycerate-dependent phosphoglycerate mutase n=1 Tax=Microlunatus soli TaxID=630515 RepID=A0A1H1XWA4_9ACTN|nr:histidine phosphatase family protein [Microlunatus soli]SDT13311.1 2,3-bisphosphoglycerate-dependent phosphoglycerate mutase [Microlunatus soli]